MKTKVLWIEDSARLELRSMTGPIYMSEDYDLNLAEDATKAVRYLSVKEYDVVILDMRLPPGADSYWVDFYHTKGSDKALAHLGMELAEWLVNGRVDFPTKKPEWISPLHVAVFTVENDQTVHDRLEKLKISVYEHKTAGLKDTILIEIIKRVLEQKKKGELSHDGNPI